MQHAIAVAQSQVACAIDPFAVYPDEPLAGEFVIHVVAPRDAGAAEA